VRQAGERALHAGDLTASRSLFDTAYALAVNDDDATEAGRSALGLGGLWVHEHREAVRGAEVEWRQRTAAERLDRRGAHPLLVLRLRTRLAAEADYRAGTHEGVLRQLDRARAWGDPVAHAEALSLAHHCLLGPDQAERRLCLARELLGVASESGRRIDVLMGLYWWAVDLVLLGDPHADRALVQLRAALEQSPNLALGFTTQALEVMLAIRAGRLVEADALAERCAASGTRAGDVDVTGWSGAQQVAIHWLRGRLADLLPMLQETVAAPALSIADDAFVAALAVAAAEAGDRVAAAGALARLRGKGFGELVRSSSWLVAVYGAIEAAHRLGDRSVAAEAAQVLTPFAELPMLASLGVACFGSTRHALGLAAATTGDLATAESQLREAVRANEALGHRPAAALTRHRLAEVLAGRPGDRRQEEAAALRARAAQDAHELGLRLPAYVSSAPVRTASAPPEPADICRRAGNLWRVELGGKEIHVEHSLGLGYLRELVARPGVAVSAVELAGVDVEQVDQPVLDERAVTAYRRRLAELDDRLARSDAAGDAEASQRAGEEREALLGELRGAMGACGRVRHFAADRDRARVAVTKALRRAVDRIALVDGELGAALHDAIHTGGHCRYDPAALRAGLRERAEVDTGRAAESPAAHYGERRDD